MFTNISVIPASSIKTRPETRRHTVFRICLLSDLYKDRVSEEFYARVFEGGRMTIPKLVVEMLEIEA